MPTAHLNAGRLAAGCAAAPERSRARPPRAPAPPWTAAPPSGSTKLVSSAGTPGAPAVVRLGRATARGVAVSVGCLSSNGPSGRLSLVAVATPTAEAATTDGSSVEAVRTTEEAAQREPSI